MATNGSTSVSVTSYDTLKFNWVQVGQSTPNNYTIINWSLQLVAGTAGKIISSVQKSWRVTVNGVTYSGTNRIAIENNATVTLASGQATIYHEADGTKTFSYSFSQEFDITFAGSQVGTKTGSGTGELNTILRATQPVLNTTSIDIGNSVTISTPRASTAFTHDLAYSFVGGGYTSIATDVADSTNWSVPVSLINSIPNTTSGTVTIRCTTKKGGTVIGTKTVLLTAKVPATIKPTISEVTFAETTTGLASTYGAYIQSKSRINVVVKASGSYGSTIKSYRTIFEGKTYSTDNFITDAVTGSGDIDVVVTVTDTRGRTAKVTKSVSVLSYSAPKITALRVARYNEKGQADPNGVYVWLRTAYSVASLNGKNKATAKVEYKKATDSTWESLDNLTELNFDNTLKPTDVTFSTDYEYDFKVSLTDAFNSASPVTYSAYLPSGAVILDIRADGKGIAFFKTSTKDGVDIAGALPGSAISLASGQNLNSLTTPGFYVIPDETISATILNKPYTDSATASIKVEQTGTDKAVQILQKSTKTDGAIYERGYDKDGWGAWSMVYSGAGKLLWEGTTALTDANTITLKEAISAQQSGIVVVFSPYNSSSGAALTYGFICHFIPKQLLSAVVPNVNNVLGVLVPMAEGKYASNGTKFLRITDTKINGSADNTASGTANGITYNNNRYALRYVIGV